MDPDLSELGELIPLDPTQFIGIPLALVGAVFLSLGAQFQHRGVVKVEANTADTLGKGLNGRQLALLLARPSWVLGTLMLGLAIVFQLSSLYFAPLIVVQPLGALALVITSIMNSRINKVSLNRKSITAIVMCVGGVFLFVGVAAFTAVDKPVQARQLITILIVLAGTFVVFFGNRFVREQCNGLFGFGDRQGSDILAFPVTVKPQSSVREWFRALPTDMTVKSPLECVQHGVTSLN